jgi:hypothetical protein
MKVLTSLLLAFALFAVGCGRDEARRDGSKVGEIAEVFEVEVEVDGSTASAKFPLLEGSVLRTNERGAAQFRLDHKFNDCRIWPNNELQLVPAPRLMEFRRGQTHCSTVNGDTRSVELQARDAVIDVRDAVFKVVVGEREVEVHVFRGFVEVRPHGAAPGEGRLVGPGSGITLVIGEEPDRPVPVDVVGLDSPQKEAVTEMVAAKGRPDFSRPAAEGSPTLQAIERERVIEVAFPRGTSHESRQFIDSFLSFLADEWDVEVRSRAVSDGEARGALRSGGADVVAGPGAVPSGESIAFFEDDNQHVTSLHVKSGDARFAESVQRFLKAALETGEYGQRYLDAFGAVPPYDALRPLVFPATEPVAPSPGSSSTTSGPSPTSTTPTSSTGPQGTASPNTTSSGLPPTPVPPSSPTTAAPVTRCEGKVATIVGTSGPDQLRGTPGPDVIAGLGGDDELHGDGGNDTICGGGGTDRIWGDDGADTVVGNEERDYLYGSAGDDRLFGNDGDDRLGGGEGADLLDGGIGDDTLLGNQGADTMLGGEGTDVIKAIPGAHEDGSPDVLDGGAGNDVLESADGVPNDVLNGGAGDRDRCAPDSGEQATACEFPV